MRQLDSLAVTPQMIDEYLLVLDREGKTEGTIRVCHNILRSWYQSLPEEKCLAADTIEVWERFGRDKSLAERTILDRVTTVKRFLRYLEDPDSFGTRRKEKDEKPLAEVLTTREEYQLLLQTAKELGHRRTYLLIKTMVCLGVRSTEMPQLSVEGLRQETMWISFRDATRSVTMVEPIRTELLKYAFEQGIETGPVFITRDGQPMQHFLIWKGIKKVCRQVGLPENKGTPKSLHQLYINTRKAATEKSAEKAEINYRTLLELEEELIRWN